MHKCQHYIHDTSETRKWKIEKYVRSSTYKNTACQSQILTHLGQMHFLKSEVDLIDLGESPMMTGDGLPVPHQQ
jgi:hypothetical protein